MRKRGPVRVRVWVLVLVLVLARALVLMMVLLASVTKSAGTDADDKRRGGAAAPLGRSSTTANAMA